MATKNNSNHVISLFTPYDSILLRPTQRALDSLHASQVLAVSYFSGIYGLPVNSLLSSYTGLPAIPECSRHAPNSAL